MKRQLLFVFLLAMLLLPAAHLAAQNDIQIMVTPKVRHFPSSGFSYIDDPARYFDIQLLNTSGSPKQIYLKLEISTDFTATGENYYLRTRETAQPLTPLTVGTAPMLLNRSHFDQLLGHLSHGDIDYYVGSNSTLQALNNILTLPEGIYNICLTPYYWTGNNTATPQKAGETFCYRFTICYSGSAPEFTSPIMGNSSANLNNSNPANNLLINTQTNTRRKKLLNASSRPSTNTSSTATSVSLTPLRNRTSIATSDSRNSSQYAVLPAERVVNFNWTGVISNCLSPNDFNYTLKIVEVYKNQNLHDAIERNATLATIKAGTKTAYRYDTLTNHAFSLKKGHVYAMQVIATPNKSLFSDVKLGNDGKSQIIAFVWGSDEVIQEDVPTKITYSSNENNIRKKIRDPFLVSPGKDLDAIESFTERFPSEAGDIPAGDKNARYVSESVARMNGNVPFYQLPVSSDSLSVKWMPVRGDSIFKVDYFVELYEYKGGSIGASLTTQPLKKTTIVKQAPIDTFGIKGTTLMELASGEWSGLLEEGFKYIVLLKADAYYSYDYRTTYTITEYIHSTPVTRDSTLNEIRFGDTTFVSNVVFSWGIDSGALDKVTPPQFTYPVMLTDKPLDDTSWSEDEFPEITKRKDFSFNWDRAQGVYYEDTVYYRLRVGKLPDKTKPSEVTSFFFTKDSITATEYIDSTLFDTLKTDAQYVAVLDISIKQMEDTSQHYDLLNGGKSHYAAFRLKEEPEFKSDLNTKLVCDSSKYNALEKEPIFPSPQTLIKEAREFKMGEFPMVMQRAQYDSTKKTYSGDGYIIWRPLGVDVRLKVDFKDIKFNKNYEIIAGTATSSATDSATYLSAMTNELGLDLDSLGTPELNKIVAKLGQNEEIKKKYETFKSWGEKYAKKYGGLLGPLQGGNVATEVLTFPLSVTDEKITGSKNVVFVINNMYFSPVASLMGFWAIFAASSDNAYVPFLANNICMEPGNLLGNADQHIEMYMGRNYEFDLSKGYKMRFKKASSFSDPKDGTVIVIDSGKLKDLFVDIDFQMNPEDLRKIDKDGKALKGNPTDPESCVKASFRANLRDWDDWMVQIKMDAFAPADCENFSFYPTGKGIWYDHSSTKTPDEIAFPKGYLTGGMDTVKGKGNKTDTQQQAEKDKTMSKERLEWQGFYWNEMTIFLSEEISNTFTDKKEPKDSMVVYHYGINNSQTDSALYHRTGTRVNFGAKDIFIDTCGFTAEFFVRDILKAETKKGGGWAFSLDTISVSILKNDFKHASIKGAFGVPLFSGDFHYHCAIGADSLTFNIDVMDDTLDLDLWIAKVLFDKKSSCFRVKKIYDEEDTRFDMTISGKINIDFNAIDVPFNFALCKFEGMGMRNYNTIKDTSTVDGFEFTLGKWSFASPQHSIGGVASDKYGKLHNLAAPDGGEVGSLDIAGIFTASLKELKPYASYDSKAKKLKLGFDTELSLKVNFGENNAFGGSFGFKLWGTCEPFNNFKVSKPEFELGKIGVQCNLDVFDLEGELEFPSKDDKSFKTGLKGKLNVSCLGGSVQLKMSAGFGTAEKKNGAGTYSWWFLDGGCKFPGGIPLGAISINGFSGGFAYNMESTRDLSSLTCQNLLAKAEDNSKQNTAVNSDAQFVPKYDYWVANAGISMVLTGAENTMNADGLVSLRIGEGHFTGIFIQANAYVMTKMDKSKTPGDGTNNSGSLVKASALMGYEQTSEWNYFRISINAKLDINLDKLLKGLSSTTVGGAVQAVHSGLMRAGASIVGGVDTVLNNLGSVGSSLKKHTQSLREDAVESSTGSGGALPSFSIEAKIPIDFELKHYKKNTADGKKGTTDWYFAIGKPKYDERVQLKSNLDLVIAKAEAEFTFYLQTGNAFAYELPPLSQSLKEFFGLEKKGKEMQKGASEEGVKKTRKIPNDDWLKIDKGGGFCMGSTFHTRLEFCCFLYLNIEADLGFDIAMLDVTGLGCPGHGQIGKNNFYATGRVYAALQGEVGLKINLGFWSGKIKLLSAGVGALLQGGGPNPSYAYGLLRFKVSALNGLLKFSTSVDFSMGEVCVPGAGDPLANVKLFQSVTPGYENENTAKESKNAISALTIGAIVSNMPWDQEIPLSDNDRTRKFRFTLLEDDCKYSTAANTQYAVVSGRNRLVFTNNKNDANSILFESEEGGFVPDVNNKLYLKARAFEWRKKLKSNEISSKGLRSDDAYHVSGSNKGDIYNNAPDYCWRNPTYLDEDQKKKYEIRTWTQDTTLFFKTKPMGYTLNNQVVFAWPYNGEINFPNKEYVYRNGHYWVNLYLFKDRPDLFKTNNSGNRTCKIILFTNNIVGIYLGNNYEYELSYVYDASGKLPLLRIQLPDKIVGLGGGFKIKIYSIEKSKFEAGLKQEDLAITKVDQEKSRIAISDQTYADAINAHNNPNGSSGKGSSSRFGSSKGNSKNDQIQSSVIFANGKGKGNVNMPNTPQIKGRSHPSNTAPVSFSNSSPKNVVNIRNNQLEDVYNSLQESGKDTMYYKRTRLKNAIDVLDRDGDLIYCWTWAATTTGWGGARKTPDYEALLKTDTYGEERPTDFISAKYNLLSSTCTVTVKKDKIILNPHYANSVLLNARGHLFLPHDYQDPAMYNTNCIQPPRAFFLTNYNAEMNELHNRYFQHFLDLERSFKSYSEVSSFKKGLSAADIQNLDRTMAKGLVANPNYAFSNISRRIKAGTLFERCNEANYHPTAIDKPKILDFEATVQNFVPYKEEDFNKTINMGGSDLLDSRYNNYVNGVRIIDYATPSLMDDVVKFHNFFQRNQQLAQYFNKKSWKDKKKIVVDLTDKYKYAMFEYPEPFPFQMPLLYLPMHYMSIKNALYEYGDSFITSGGITIYKKNYDKSRYFIYHKQLPKRYWNWSYYWWSAKGQGTEDAGEGLDRNFYDGGGRTRSTIYYNAVPGHPDQRLDHILGSWYYHEAYPTQFSNSLSYAFVTSNCSNFEATLMKIAVAVKNNDPIVFFPTKQVYTNAKYYYSLKNISSFNKILSKPYLEVKSYDSDTEFNYK